MARILAIDYGKKRCGLAVSDPLQIIANPLDTVPAHQLLKFITDYVAHEEVSTIVIGEPHKLDGSDSETMTYIRPFLRQLKKALPNMPVEMVDERFTTKIATQAMIDGGVSKKDRNNKSGLVDRVSATLILEMYMEKLRFSSPLLR